MALPHDHQHEHDEQFSSWPDDGPCCPDEPGVRIRAITFEELDDYLEQLTNPPEPAPWSVPAPAASTTRASWTAMAALAPPPWPSTNGGGPPTGTPGGPPCRSG